MNPIIKSNYIAPNLCPLANSHHLNPLFSAFIHTSLNVPDLI